MVTLQLQWYICSYIRVTNLMTRPAGPLIYQADHEKQVGKPIKEVGNFVNVVGDLVKQVGGRYKQSVTR